MPERDPEGEAPSGLPGEDVEPAPLGTPEASPEAHGEPGRGEEAMPGLPTAGEPPASG